MIEAETPVVAADIDVISEGTRPEDDETCDKIVEGRLDTVLP